MLFSDMPYTKTVVCLANSRKLVAIAYEKQAEQIEYFANQVSA
jgi:hypothetical protein